MSHPTYLVTGSMGCIGAWVLHHLVNQNKKAISYDLSTTRHRLAPLLTPDQQKAITFIQGDVTNFDQIKQTITTHNITHIIHLAALQVPFCRADPVLGNHVNVVGTTNIFEAAHQAGIPHVTFASSIAVYGRADQYPTGLLQHNAQPHPHTIYGVTKVANENTARIYWQDHKISSIGLRPYTVYGVGRDQGLTSDPTKAIHAALQGEPFEIGFSGSMQFQLASDVAQQFIAAADQTGFQNAATFNLGGPVTSVAQFVSHIREILPHAQITQKPNQLPFPTGFDDAALRTAVPTVYETPLNQGITQTVDLFRQTMS